MGYTIVYGRQFLRTTRGIVPLVLCGSNNCTELINGREVRVRDWNVFYSGKMVELSDLDFLNMVRDLHKDGQESQCFKFRGKWIDDKGAVKFFENGVRTAVSIEEIVKRLPYQSLSCYLSVWPNDSGNNHDSGNRIELEQCNIKTTLELEKWIDQAKARRQELTDCSTYICIHFWGKKPLKLGNQPNSKGQVIAKLSNGYVYDYTKDLSIRYSKDIMKAIVFDSVEEALEKIGTNFGLKFISAANQTPRNFAIRVIGGNSHCVYVKKKTAKYLKTSRSTDTAKMFISRRSAEKYIETMLQGRFEKVKDFEVVNITELAA